VPIESQLARYHNTEALIIVNECDTAAALQCSFHCR